jgi:DNA-binding CsgD family transcriptional regulator
MLPGQPPVPIQHWAATRQDLIRNGFLLTTLGSFSPNSGVSGWGVASLSNVLSELDENQKLCLRLVAEGYTSKQIAQQTHLSAGTVDQYIFRANAILGAADRREAARLLLAAEQNAPLKRSQLKPGKLAGEPKHALMGAQGKNLPDHSAHDSMVHHPGLSHRELNPARFSSVLRRAMAVTGGEPHELNFRQKLVATSWVALATGGTLSALVAVGYWLNHLMS